MLRARVFGSLVGLLTLAGCESPTEPDPFRDVPPIAGINSICSAAYGGDCTSVGNNREITMGEGRVYLKGNLPATADCAWWNGLRVQVTYPDGHTGSAGIYKEYVFYLMRCFAHWSSGSFDLQPGRHRVTVTARMEGVDETDELIINCPNSGARPSVRTDGGTEGVAGNPGSPPPVVP